MLDALNSQEESQLGFEPRLQWWQAGVFPLHHTAAFEKEKAFETEVEQKGRCLCVREKNLLHL